MSEHDLPASLPDTQDDPTLPRLPRSFAPSPLQQAKPAASPLQSEVEAAIKDIAAATPQPLPTIAVEAPHVPLRKIIPREEFDEQGMDMASVKELRHMLESAEEQADALYEEARQEGFLAGQQEGRREFLRVCADAVEAVRTQLFQLEDVLVPTVLLAVERVFGQFEDVELIRRVLRAALKDLGYAIGVVVRVPPDKTEDMRAALAALTKDDDVIAKSISSVEGDPSLKNDEILLETIQGRVHVGVPYQLARLKTGLGVKA